MTGRAKQRDSWRLQAVQATVDRERRREQREGKADRG